MKNVLQYLEQTVKMNKNKIAVIEEEKKCTYEELEKYSKSVGSKLIEYKIQRKPIPVLMDKGISALISFFGIVYAGGFYVLLNPELPKERLEKILDILKPNTIITDELVISATCTSSVSGNTCAGFNNVVVPTETTLAYNVPIKAATVITVNTVAM